MLTGCFKAEPKHSYSEVVAILEHERKELETATAEAVEMAKGIAAAKVNRSMEGSRLKIAMAGPPCPERDEEIKRINENIKSHDQTLQSSDKWISEAAAKVSSHGARVDWAEKQLEGIRERDHIP
jgi:hypothetical protein